MENVLEFWPLRFIQIVKTIRMRSIMIFSTLTWHLHLLTPSDNVPSINNISVHLKIDPNNYGLMGWLSLPDFQ